MEKDQHIGQCKLCHKENIKLSFEHYPPKCSFNSESRILKFMLPLTEQEYTKVRRGLGDYYLCEECNRFMGSSYVKEWKKFSDIMIYLYKENRSDVAEFPSDLFSSMQKQIILMAYLSSGFKVPDYLSQKILNKDKYIFTKSDIVDNFDVEIFVIDNLNQKLSIKRTGLKSVAFKSGEIRVSSELHHLFFILEHVKKSSDYVGDDSYCASSIFLPNTMKEWSTIPFKFLLKGNEDTL